ncbi:MAG: hypothetical protein JXA08_09100 [Methanomicrobiaceae archaeon]|nr:hypothetical protein [Methanomicrobiaceae archaeon]
MHSIVGSDAPDALQFLNGLTPTDRLLHLYGYRSTGTFRQAREETGPLPASPLSARVHEIMGHFLDFRKVSLFESQMLNSFHSTESTEILLYTLTTGDASHLQIITRLANRLRMDTRLHIPEEVYSPPVERRASGWGFGNIEVI